MWYMFVEGGIEHIFVSTQDLHEIPSTDGF